MGVQSLSQCAGEHALRHACHPAPDPGVAEATGDTERDAGVRLWVLSEALTGVTFS